VSLHPIRRAGRPDLTIAKTFKKFSKVKLLNSIFLNIEFRNKRSKNAPSFSFFGISTAIFQQFLPKILQNRRFFLSKKKKAWQKRKLRANVRSSFLVRAPVYFFLYIGKKNWYNQPSCSYSNFIAKLTANQNSYLEKVFNVLPTGKIQCQAILNPILQWLPLSTTGWSALFRTITDAIISSYDQYHTPYRLIPHANRAVIFPFLNRVSLHPVRWAGRSQLCYKTFKKFPNIGLNADNQS